MLDNYAIFKYVTGLRAAISMDKEENDSNQKEPMREHDPSYCSVIVKRFI
jgi:hypothetical protein